MNATDTLTEYQYETILRTIFENKVYGRSLQVYIRYLESDGRKQKKLERQLEAAGVIERVGDEWHATAKLWDELPCETVDVLELWRESRKTWNRNKDLPIIRLAFMTWGQKKTLVECAGDYVWHAHNSTPLQYTTQLQASDHEAVLKPGTDLPGGVRLAVAAVEANLRERGQRNFPEVELVVTRPALVKYASETLAQERLEKAYRRNLKWGLVEAGAATEEQTRAFEASDTPPFMNSKSNLGDDPAKWQENLAIAIVNEAEKLEERQRRLESLRAVQRGVESVGGWEKFLADYRAAIEAESRKG